MKKLKRLIAGLLIFTPAMVAAQISPAPTKVGGGDNGGNSYNGFLFNFTDLTYSTSATVDMSIYNGSKVSAGVYAGSATIPAVNIWDGSESTGNIVVLNYLALSSASATDSITVKSTNGLTGASISINGIVLANGAQWLQQPTTTGTAISIMNAITAAFPQLKSTQASSIVYTTATFGSYANTWAYTSTTSSITVASATFMGGQDIASFTINGQKFTEGFGATQWAAQTNSSVTAGNIAALINKSSTTLLIVSTNGFTSQTVYTTSTLNGSAYNYAITSSSPTALSSTTMTGGINPQFALGGKVFTSSITENFTLAMPVFMSSAAATVVGGLTFGTTYYVVPLGSYSFELAKFSTSAIADFGLSGSTVDLVVITSTNSQVGTNTYKFNAVIPNGLSLSTYTWQSSDDGVNWATSIATAAVTGPATISTTVVPTPGLIDFGFYNFRYLRFNVTASTGGGVFIQVPINIKQDGTGRF